MLLFDTYNVMRCNVIEGVVESGGIINYLGTFQAALDARSMNKPVYVAAESFKVFNVVCHSGIDYFG